MPSSLHLPSSRHAAAPRPARPTFTIHHSPFTISSAPRAFSLIELLVVIGIIAIMAAITGPAIKSLTKNNDQSQAVNLIRSMLSAARSIAISQHRQAGVVFFEETANNSLPVNTAQTAMQIFVEDYNQFQYTPLAQGNTVFISSASAARQYLPTGIMIATLNDDPTQLITGTNASGSNARAIVFDANGNMLTRNGMARPSMVSAATPAPGPWPGIYPWAYGDWHFNPPGTAASNAVSSPGFYIFNMNDFKEQVGSASDAQRSAWLRSNSTAILVNANTGLVIR